MSTRVNITINNLTSYQVTCTNITCEAFDNMTATSLNRVGSQIAANSTGSFTSQTNNRIFCTWTDTQGTVYKMAMTCPNNSTNSACGINGNEGLQTYLEHGTPASFTFNLGQVNQADWDSGSSNGRNIIQYDNCSGLGGEV